MRMSFQQNTPTNVNKNPLAVSKFKKKKQDCKSKVKQSNHLTFLGVIHIFINHLQVVFFTVKMFFFNYSYAATLHYYYHLKHISLGPSKSIKFNFTNIGLVASKTDELATYMDLDMKGRVSLE